MSKKRTAPTPKSTAVFVGDIGPLGSPWPFGFGGVAAATAAGAGGAAESFGGGGGHVISPLLTTVVPRSTSSFMSMLTLSFSMLFVFTMSSVKRRRFVAYSVDACFESRLGRSL